MADIEIDTNVKDFTNRNNFGIIVCTSGTRPNAVDGKAIYETDTDNFLIYNGAAWIDISGGAAADHGALLGLGDDDHTQYLLVNGTRSMTGTLNFDDNNAANVGTIDMNDIAANTDPDITTHDSIVPSGGSLYDLGSSSRVFNAIYVDQILGNGVDIPVQIIQKLGTLDPETPLHQFTPIIANLATANDYSESSAANIFHMCSWVENDGTTPVVAMHGSAHATGPGAWAWGGNFVAYTKASATSTSKAVGCEIDYGNLTTAAADAVGLEITSQGDYASTAGISISAAPRATPPYNQNSPNTAVLVQAVGGANPIGGANAAILRGTGTSMPYGIEFANATFSAAAIALANGPAIYQKCTAGTLRNLIGIDGSNNLIVGDNTDVSMVYIRPDLRIESLEGTGLVVATLDTNGQLQRGGVDVATKAYVDDEIDDAIADHIAGYH